MGFLNWPGLVLFLAGFIGAILLGDALGITSEGPQTIAGGLFIAGADVAYRKWWVKCRLTDRARGATFLFVPLWMFGCFWVALGVFYTIRDGM